MNEKKFVVCQVCPKKCHLDDGRVGACGVRWAREGRVVPLFPHRISALHIDPMEKKPLYHFMPGEQILSVGTFGCTMNCGFCQNYSLLDPPTENEGEDISGEKLVSICREQGIKAIAFTYNEPFVNYEFVTETFAIAKSEGLATVLVTNGNVELSVLKEVLVFVDAMNIDLKAFDCEFYKKQGGDFETVKKTIRYAAEQGVHVEICLLVIPGENDDMILFEEMLKWLKETSENIILHINRYYPARNYTLPSTPKETLLKMRDKAFEYLPYVYIGNLPFVSQDTVCSCGEILINRNDWEVKVMLDGNKCPKCNKEIPVIFK